MFVPSDDRSMDSVAVVDYFDDNSGTCMRVVEELCHERDEISCVLDATLRFMMW